MFEGDKLLLLFAFGYNVSLAVFCLFWENSGDEKREEWGAIKEEEEEENDDEEDDDQEYDYGTPRP